MGNLSCGLWFIVDNNGKTTSGKTTNKHGRIMDIGYAAMPFVHVNIAMEAMVNL